MSDFTNYCQECSLCCKLLGVAELRKPPGILCWFCDPGHGCTIHSKRPSECRDYVCTWLQTHQEGRTPLAMELRPDRSKVVIDRRLREHAYNVRCDPEFPDAWRAANVQRVLAALVKGTGAAIFLIKPTGEEQRLKLLDSN